MAINKVIVNGETKVDLTSDTATSDKVLSGYTFHDSTGELKTGSFNGGSGNIPFYFLKVPYLHINDPDGCLYGDLPCKYEINVDTEAGMFWVYNLFDENTETGRIVLFIGTHVTGTSVPYNDEYFYVFSQKPINNVVVTLTTGDGY